MTKQTLRICSLSLFAALAIATLYVCGVSGESQVKTDTYIPVTGAPVAEAETGDRLSDTIYRRNRGIEERFNCKISVTGQNRIRPSDIEKEVMAGDSNYDLWLSYDIETLGAIEYLLPWEEIPYVNLDKEWWNPMATEVFQLGGKTYAAAGNYSLSVLSRASGFVFNKDIFADVNPGVDIYALAKDGKWTIDRLYDFAKDAYSDLNGDTMMDENAINKIL